ncbi:MAG TPA: putative oxidoreductase C-terminal domain-containing protein [Chitinophaga sp.]|uniref:putative oxidoreductase C-terminal domain-containing protein n=1 Tax=Chitinophaga sp. TaxID=1869181 RepID=UPI002DB9A8E8|nr:putative oxidoreductase C-terminal domain-containing protein [Chitinophaga sp.]HEU4551339.1 putative oxidoreductase C-terminal domain-containing protein [Chitinophaga sp.]
MNKKQIVTSLFVLSMMNNACNTGQQEKEADAGPPPAVQLITLDPGHFHAALVQKSMTPGIDSVVHVYAPDGPELKEQLRFIDQYNTRAETPTHWKEEVYTGPDFLEKMVQEKKGNVVVMAGNNRRKTEYIQKAVAAGMNVLADKPMAISTEGFARLQQAFDDARSKKVLLYDIMTERSEITNTLQGELSRIHDVFGDLQTGTEKNPGVEMKSVHNLYKYVSGKALTRPAWFFDPMQQGDAIVDVGTHLVDLVQWECFPEVVLDYKKDIQLQSARKWPTPITRSQFSIITGLDSFPDFLHPYVKDTMLNVHANGEASYTLKGVHVKVTALWQYAGPEGSGDTHYSILRGSNSNLVIRQGQEEKYEPTLYVEPQGKANTPAFEKTLQNALQQLESKYPGLSLEKSSKGWKIVIPAKYKNGHEAHFAQVLQRYMQYLQQGSLPDWEVPGMIAKYYTTTKALEMSAEK